MIKRTWNPVQYDRLPGDEAVPELSERWLQAAQVTWIALAVLAAAILVTSLPGYAQAFRGELAHIGAQNHSVGVTVIAILSGLASLAAALLSLILAALFFRSRLAEPLAAALSFFLLLYAIVMAGPLETWAAYWLGDNAPVMRLQGLLIALPSVALLALFPDGRFVPPGTRWLVILTIPLSIAMLFLPLPGAGAFAGAGLILTILLAVTLRCCGPYAPWAAGRPSSAPASPHA